MTTFLTEVDKDYLASLEMFKDQIIRHLGTDLRVIEIDEKVNRWFAMMAEKDKEIAALKRKLSTANNMRR